MDELKKEVSNFDDYELLSIYSNESGLSIHVNEPEQVMTINQIAILLDIPVGRVHILCDDKKIPHSRPFGGQMYFLRSDILEWIKRSSVPCKDI